MSHRHVRMTAAVLMALSSFTRPALAQQRYTATQTGQVVGLQDSARETTVSVMPAAGNVAVEMRIKGFNILRFPYESMEDFKGTRGPTVGIPFVGPWSDLLDEQAFYANGRRYAFDMELGNVRGNRPGHGFLTSATEWRVVEVKADSRSAWVTSTLDVYRNPLWMKQWPFAHTIDITYRLQDGVLEVATRIKNLSLEPMPVSIGFHPYFQLSESRRDDWKIAVGARRHWPVGEDKAPTGATQPIETFFANPADVAIRDLHIDDVFSDLVRDDRGRATMSIVGKSQRIDVLVGPNYRGMVIWAPKPEPTADAGAPAQDRNFVCLEPLAAVINGLNLAHKGYFKELQSIPPDGVWQESFWVRATGF